MPARDLGDVTAAIVARLRKRRSSVFARVDEPACRAVIEAVIAAMTADLDAGKAAAVRDFAGEQLPRLASAGLTFADLRFLAQTTRRELHAALEPGDELARVDDWLFEFVQVCSMHYILAREATLQERSSRLELERLESQLDELRIALREKTELLEFIRQASTPIAPVVQGILVVPLVGTFDTFRAELLTEKLLTEIARVHARAAILDVSGVPVFDTAAAQLIVRLARSVRLLGTEVFLVGIGPESARTIVSLGIDLTQLRTLATLQDGLEQALRLQHLGICRLAV